MNALANMGANMSAMLSGNSPLTETQSDNAKGAEIGVAEKPQSSAPANPLITNPTQDALRQDAESAEGNGGERHSLQSVKEGLKRAPPHLLKSISTLIRLRAMQFIVHCLESRIL